MSSNTPLSLRKNIFWNAFGTSVYSAGQWLFLIIVVRLAGLNQAGTFSLAWAVAMPLFGIAIYGMRIFQSSDITGKYSDGDYFVSRLISGGIILPIAILICLINSYSLYASSIILIITLYRSVESFSDVIYGFQQKKERMDFIGISFIYRTVLSLTAFTVILLLTRNILPSATSLFISSLLVLLLYDLPRTFTLRPNIRLFSLNNTGKLFLECMPLALCSISSFYVINIPRYGVEKYLSTEDLGIFSSVSMPAYIITLLASFICLPFAKRAAEYFHGGNTGKFIKLFLLGALATSLAGTIAVIVSLAIGDKLLYVLYNIDFKEHVTLLALIMGGTTFLAQVWLLNTAATAARYLWSQACILVVSAVLSTPITSILVRKYQLIGAGFSFFVSCIIQFTGFLILFIFIIIKKTNTLRKNKLS